MFRVACAMLGFSALVALIPFGEDEPSKPLVMAQTGWNSIDHPASYIPFNLNPDPAIPVQQPGWQLPNVTMPAIDFNQIFPRKSPPSTHRCDPFGEGALVEWGDC